MTTAWHNVGCYIREDTMPCETMLAFGLPYSALTSDQSRALSPDAVRCWCPRCVVVVAVLVSHGLLWKLRNAHASSVVYSSYLLGFSHRTSRTSCFCFAVCSVNICTQLLQPRTELQLMSLKLCMLFPYYPSRYMQHDVSWRRLHHVYWWQLYGREQLTMMCWQYCWASLAIVTCKAAILQTLVAVITQL